MFSLVKIFIIVAIPLICYLLSNARGKELNINELDVKTSLALKGILAILIVVTHLGGELGIFNIINSQYTNFSTFAVSLFFFLSGYGLSKSYRIKGIGYLTDFLHKRAQRLLPAFIITLLVWLLICNKSADCSHIISDVKHGVLPPPNSWFVYDIFLFYLSFYFSTKASSIFGGYVLGLVLQCTIIIISTLYCYKMSYGPYWYNTSPMMVIGLLWGYYERAIIKILTIHCNTCIMALLLITISIKIMKYSGLLPTLLLWSDSWFEAVGTIIIIYLYKVRSFYFFSFLGSISYELYLTHGVFEKYNLFIIQSATVSCYASGLIYFGISFIEALLSAWILKHLCSKFIRKEK